tara:strand:- start:353 stop:487 length:135 start_codon:yes stop_codon:yes gene_type:complete
MDSKNKEYLYVELNRILELIESGQAYEAKIPLEGLINEIKYDQL